MYRVEYKSHGPYSSWSRLDGYGCESSALASAARAAHKYFMVRVLDPRGNVIWCD